jgi:hypothetical protein
MPFDASEYLGYDPQPLQKQEREWLLSATIEVCRKHLNGRRTKLDGSSEENLSIE